MIHIYDVTTCVTYLWALLGVGRDPIACLATHLKRLAQQTIIQFTSGKNRLMLISAALPHKKIT